MLACWALRKGMFGLSAGRALAQPSLPSSQAGPSAHTARAPLPVPCRLPPLPRTRNTKAAGLEHEGVRPAACLRLYAAPGKCQCANVLSSMQDFGARDPYEAEVKSNFANKVLGNADTSHVIRRAACFFYTLLCVCPACFAVLAGQRVLLTQYV